MTSRALVIGIESYAQCKAGLTGNVLPGVIVDTLHFYDWLVSDAKLKPEDIWLHLQPADKTPAQAHARALEASYQSIADSLFTLRDRCVSQTERLFVFFSGHGFQFGSDLACRPEDVLVCADFVDLRRSGNRTIRVNELLAVLAGLGPGEQYYFLDACRNLISPAALSVGNLGINLPPSPLGTPSQFALFSTTEGVTAVAPTPFVATLVGGLRGVGQAKQWGFDETDTSGDGERLLVNFQSLFGYVSTTVSAKSGQQPSRQVWGDAPGELVILYPPGPDPVTECQVTVSGVAPEDVVIATAQLGPIVAASVSCKGGSGVLPLRSALPYSVSIAGGTKYVVTPARRLAPMFQPLALQFSAAPRPISFAEPDPDEVEIDPYMEAWAEGATSEVPVHLRAPAVNPLTAVVITGRAHGADGRPVKVERRLLPAMRMNPEDEAWSAGLFPGSYQAVLWEAGKQLDKQDFAVEPAGLQTKALEVAFTLPTPNDELHKALLSGVLAKQTTRLAYQLMSSADQSLAVALALVAMDLAWPDDSAQPGTAFLAQLWPEAEGQSGLLLLVAGDTGAGPEVRELGTELPGKEHPAVPGLHCAYAALPAGNYPAELSVSGERHRVSWPILPGRLTVVVVTARPQLPQSYSLYLLPARRSSSLLAEEELRDFDPYTAARLLESAEYAFDRRFPLPKLDVHFVDPLLLVMQAYTLLRGPNLMAARASILTLLRMFPTLPDVIALARLGGLTASCTSYPGDFAGVPALPAPPLFREGLQALSAEERAHYSGQSPESVTFCGPFLRWRL